MKAEIATLAERIVEPVAAQLTKQYLDRVIAQIRRGFKQLNANRSSADTDFEVMAVTILEVIKPKLSDPDFTRMVDRLSGAMAGFCQGNREPKRSPSTDVGAKASAMLDGRGLGGEIIIARSCCLTIMQAVTPSRAVPMRTFLAGLLISVALPCSAAEIQIKGDKIFVLGTIEIGDDQKFENAVKPYDQQMVVVLHSGGGFQRPAYNMGWLIREKGWSTHVEQWCTSACTLIWLGGVKHSKTATSLIGFHSSTETSTGEVSPSGNAQALRYLTDLGYSEQVGHFGRESRAFTYLTPIEAQRLDIQMEIVPSSIPGAVFAGVDLRKKPDVPKLPGLTIVPETHPFYVVKQPIPPPTDAGSLPRVKTVPIKILPLSLH